MGIPILGEMLRRASRRRLRASMRGYSLLKRSGQLGLVRQIRTDLVDCLFAEIERSASKHVFGASHSKAELLIRQYLLQRCAGIGLNKAMLFSLGRKSEPLTYPLPKAWQEILTRRGLKVDRKWSSLAWAGNVTLYFGYGVLSIAQLAAISLWATMRRQPAVRDRYAYFEGLAAGNLPQPGLDGRSHDICTWYARWDGRAASLGTLCHAVSGARKTRGVDELRVEYIGRPFHSLRGTLAISRFLAWGLKGMIVAALDALRGRWWHAMVLAEAAKAKVIQLCDANVLAADYLFHYSGTIYRPMWTYEAERKGSRILCYFYSTSEQVKLPGGYESQRYEWGAASWPVYLVWDDYQANLVRRDIDPGATIKIVGPIWFTASSTAPPAFPERSIAVFDIEPQRKSAHFGFSTLSDYVAAHPDIQIRFLQDAHAVLARFKVTMVLKRKRDIGNIGVRRYQDLVQKLAQSGGLLPVDSGVSAVRVIERCKGVISMPFTSAALYLREQGIQSVYFDPTGWIQKDDRGAHGIPILSGVGELSSWVASIFKESPENG